MLRRILFTGLLACSLAATSRAETDRERAAREIDAQMKEMVKLPPATLRVQWEGVDSDKIAFDEARFELDDTRLSYGELDDLAARAKSGQPLYDGPIDEGKHALAVTLIVHRTHVSLFEGLRRTTFKVSSVAGVPGQRGLAVTVKVKLHYDDAQKDPKKRLRLDTSVDPKMMVAVDDAPPPERPHVVVAQAEETAAPPVATAKVEEPAPLPVVKAELETRDAPRAVLKHRKVAAAAVVAEAEPVAAAPADAGAMAVLVDAGPVDAGLVDAGLVDAGPPDAGPQLATAPPDAGHLEGVASSEAPPYGLAVAVALGCFALILAVGIWRTRRR